MVVDEIDRGIDKVTEYITGHRLLATVEKNTLSIQLCGTFLSESPRSITAMKQENMKTKIGKAEWTMLPWNL